MKLIGRCHGPLKKTDTAVSALTAETADESFSSGSKDGEKYSISTSRRLNPFDWLLEPKVTQGQKSLPSQADSAKWLKYLILVPLSMLASLVFSAYFWIPLAQKNGLVEAVESFFWASLQNPVFFMLLLIGLILTSLRNLAYDVWTFIMLFRGKKRRHHPSHLPRLVHAVIVCQYKEPLEVLVATIESLAMNTLASNTIVLLACEDRDPNANDIFDALLKEYACYFRAFIKTTHHLESNEVAGKSSNENHAARGI